MGSSSRATQQRAPPSSLRTQKGTVTESGAWRLRSRSYSHDNELYRMGLRKTAQGEWAAVDNKVPAGLANAMRKMRIRSATRIKRVPSMDVDVEMEDAGNVEVLADVDVGGNTVAEETLVYNYEEIRLYLDVERDIEGGHVYVDGDGMKVETVMRSVETKSEFMVDVKTGDGLGESGDLTGRVEGEERRSNEARDSLTSIVEEREDPMDIDGLVGNEQPVDTTEADSNTGHNTRRIGKRRRKWTDPEIHYVGALLDAGYKPAAIPNLFLDRFPDGWEVTVGSVEYCRSHFLHHVRHLKESRLLCQQLGFVSGKWGKMDRVLKDAADRDAATKNAIPIEQEAERRAMMGQHSHHRWQLRKLPPFSDLNGRSYYHLQLRQLLIGQRQQWRNLIEKQYRRRLEIGLPATSGKSLQEQAYLRQLTILIQQSRHNSENPSAVWNSVVWKSYSLPVEQQELMEQKLAPTTPLNPRPTYVLGDLKRSSQILFEYDAAKLLLWQNMGPLSETEYHKEAIALLQLHPESPESLRVLTDRLRARTAEQQRRQMLEAMLHSQQQERILQSHRKRRQSAPPDNGTPQDRDNAPLEASEILQCMSGKDWDIQLMEALLDGDDSQKEQIERMLRSVIEANGERGAFVNYRMELLLLELQNKIRLQMARREQDQEIKAK